MKTVALNGAVLTLWGECLRPCTHPRHTASYLQEKLGRGAATLQRCGSDPGQGCGDRPQRKRWPREGGVAPSISEQGCDFFQPSLPRQLQAPRSRAALWGRCSRSPGSAGRHHITALLRTATAARPSCVRGCRSHPTPIQPGAHPPGSWAGCGTGPTALEKQVFPTPPGKHRGGKGKMEPVPPWGTPRARKAIQPFGTRTGEGTTRGS